MERQFKSERDKIEYYKKLKVKENNVAQSNMDKITEAYHEIEFGVVPEVTDNRSLAEKIADERGQQQQAQKNALTLMSNDGEEAIKLQNLIGTARYPDFNRYFLDIYNTLQTQIGKIRAQEAYDYIDKYISKTNLTQGVDIPNVSMLNQLITAIQNIPAPTAPTAPTAPPVNVDLSDIVLRLQALEHVLSTSANTLNSIEYNTRGLPSRQDIQDILNALQNLGNSMATSQRDNMRATLDSTNFIRDEVRAVGDQVRNEGVGNSLRFNEMLEQLREMVNTIDADSLSSVISDITDVTYGDDNNEDEYDEEDEFEDAVGEGVDDNNILRDIISDIITQIEENTGVELDDDDEISIAESISLDPFKGTENLATLIMKNSETLKRRPELKQDVEDALDEIMTVETTESLRNEFYNLKQVAEDEFWGDNDRLKGYINAYDYVVANIDKPNDKIDLATLKDNMRILFDSADISIKQLIPTTDKDLIRGLFLVNRTKLDRLYDHTKKNEKYKVEQLTKGENQMLDNFYSSVKIDDGQDEYYAYKAVSDDILTAIYRLRNSVADKLSKDLEGRIDTGETSQDFKDYKLLKKFEEPGKVYSKSFAKKNKTIADELSKSPYPYIYDYLIRQYGEPETTFGQDEVKQGNGYKKIKSILKKRVY